jgi:hypothetical protein
MHKHPRSTPVIHDFLDLIETSMLRVRIEDRARSSVVASTLKTMLDQCREEPPYATKAIPSTETVDSSSMLKQDVGISSQVRDANFALPYLSEVSRTFTVALKTYG